MGLEDEENECQVPPLVQEFMIMGTWIPVSVRERADENTWKMRQGQDFAFRH